jgi:pimeloyl-ACP methyl ester carboxylesterase
MKNNYRFFYYLAFLLCSGCHEYSWSEIDSRHPITDKIDMDSIASIPVSLEKICTDGMQPRILSANLILFSDRFSPISGQRSPFPSDNQLYFVKPACTLGINNKSQSKKCSFSLFSAIDMRVSAISQDGRKIFFLFNNNLLGAIELDEQFNPKYFHGPRVLKDEWTSLVTHDAVTDSTSLEQEYSKISQNAAILAPLIKKRYRVHFTIKSQNQFINFLAAPKNLQLFLQRGKSLQLTPLGVHETDIYRPILDSNSNTTLLADGIRIQNFGTSNQSINEMPFFSSYYNKDIDSVKTLSFLNNASANHSRTLEPKILNRGGFLSNIKDLKFSICKNTNDFDVDRRIVSMGSFHFYIFQKKDIKHKLSGPPIVYFFGGPSGLASNFDYGWDITTKAMLNAGRTIIVPFTSSSIGAGLQTSSRFRIHFTSAAHMDAEALNLFLSRFPNGNKVDLYAASFGAHFALTFLNKYPNNVRKVALEVPYAKYRDPKEYRVTQDGMRAQREFFASAIGMIGSEKILQLNDYLLSTFVKAAKYGARIVVVSGSIDKKAPAEDIPLEFSKNVTEMRVVLGDHMFASSSQETSNIVLQHLLK